MTPWKRVDVLVNGRVPLAVYTSLRTGLRFAIGDVPGPMVKACVSLVTEAKSDDGLPHTLEHLVFMGSERYPFKGFLDVIANRCFASGTNAWTDQDHTAYTLDTVGAEGFYKSFPVYLNHILRPTLSREQYLTEVHHINEKGEDAGVVYCEMQDHESEMDTILDRKMRQLIYPPTHPYAVDTGGKLKDIRELCSVDRVRDFHKHFYHIGNVFSIICGKVDHSRIQRIMEELEMTEMERMPAEFPEPFTTAVPSLASPIVETVPCPSDDPSHGAILVAWLGPPSRDVLTAEALDILFTYLTDTAVSPFHRHLIDIPNPFASSAYFHLSEQTTSCISLSLGGVPVERLDAALPVLNKVLAEHRNPATFDGERMGFVCRQALLNAHAALETRAAKNIFSTLITHQLYGDKSEDDLKARLNDTSLIEQLSRESMGFWADLVTRYFSAPAVSLIGQPSEQLVESLATAETARVEAQRARLGCDGLEKCKEEHCKAVEANTSGQPPKDLLDTLMVNNLEEFDRFAIEIHNAEDADRATKPAPIKALLDSFPFPATVHHSKDTKFCEFWLALDSASLTEDQRRLLYVFSELVFEAPATIDGKEYTADEVCCLFTRDLLDHSFHNGFSGTFDRSLVLWLKVDAGRFENLARWSQIFLRGVKIDAEKIASIATRFAGEAREKKRDGNYVCHVIMNGITCRKDSNAYLVDELVLQKVHESLAKQAKKDPRGLEARFEELRTALLSAGLNAHLLCNADEVTYSPDAWSWAKGGCETTKRFKYSAGEDGREGYEGDEVMVPLGSCESSFMAQSASYEVDWNSPHLMPVMVLTQYLSQCEGPLWKSVRGNGLAYGVWVSANVDSKEISLNIYRSTNIVQAYEKVECIVKSELGAGKLDETQFEAAKRSLICDLYTKVATISSSGSRSVLSCIQEKDPEYLRRFSQSVWEASAEDVLRLGAPHVLALFEKYARAITTHTRQASDVRKGFPKVKTVKIDTLPIQA